MAKVDARFLANLSDEEFENLLDEVEHAMLPDPPPEPPEVPYFDRYADEAYRLALQDKADWEIAEHFGISLRLFEEWLRRHKRFASRIEIARAEREFYGPRGGGSGIPNNPPVPAPGLNTAARRMSGMSGWMPWKRIPLVPHGLIAAADRQALVTLYRGEA